MKRTRLERKTPLRSSGRRIKPKKRSAAERTRIYGDGDRAAFVKAMPCLVCGRTPSDNAHITNGGTGRKDDAERTVPLCPDDPRTGWRGHHSEYDGGKRSFVAKYGVDLYAIAARIESAWQERRGLEPVGRVVARVLPTLTGEDA